MTAWTRRVTPVPVERLAALEAVYQAAEAVIDIGGRAQAERLAVAVAYARAITATLAEIAALEEGNSR